MIEKFQAYRTLETHAKGKGWCLYLQGQDSKKVNWYFFKDLMSMFSFILQYPEGELPKE